MDVMKQFNEAMAYIKGNLVNDIDATQIATLQDVLNIISAECLHF